MLQGTTPTTKVCVNLPEMEHTSSSTLPFCCSSYPPPEDEDEDCALTVYTLIISLENHQSASSIDRLSNRTLTANADWLQVKK